MHCRYTSWCTSIVPRGVVEPTVKYQRLFLILVLILSWCTGCVPGTRGIPTVVLSVSAQLLLHPATGQLGPGVVAPTLYGGGVPCYRGPSYHPLSGISIIQVPDQFFSSWAYRPLYQLFYVIEASHISLSRSLSKPRICRPPWIRLRVQFAS